jgi:release factor glutamine methyltransferase
MAMAQDTAVDGSGEVDPSGHQGLALPDGGAGVTQIRGDALLDWRRRMLAVEGHTPSRASDLDWLLDLAGGLRHAQRQAVWLHPDRLVPLERPLDAITDLWRLHRATDQPLQYLVGRCPWHDLELTVGPGVLIPRQETERLVEVALGLVSQAPRERPLCWADLGTGSGALAIALARALPGSTGLAVEASPQALAYGVLNLQTWCPAQGSEPAVRLLQGDWWQALEPWWGRLQLVVSNPPYIPSAVCEALDPVVRDHEPLQALDGGPDGLAAIRAIVAGAPQALAPHGVLVLEHHHDQSDCVAELLRRSGFSDVQAHRDLEGINRFVSGRWRDRP